MRTKVKHSFFDTPIYQLADINQLPYARYFYLSKSLQVIDAQGIAFEEIKGLKERIKAAQDKKTELQTFELYLELVESVGISLDAMLEVCSYFYFLEDEPDRIDTTYTAKKIELFKSNENCMFFFLQRSTKTYQLYLPQLTKYMAKFPKAKKINQSLVYKKLYA